MPLLAAITAKGMGVSALIRQTRPDVLLLDVFIEPEFDALSAVRDLRGDFPNLKICLLSAYIEPSLVRDLLQADVHVIFSKMMIMFPKLTPSFEKWPAEKFISTPRLTRL